MNTLNNDELAFIKELNSNQIINKMILNIILIKQIITEHLISTNPQITSLLLIINLIGTINLIGIKIPIAQTNLVKNLESCAFFLIFI